jgi:hypothetical protein
MNKKKVPLIQMKINFINILKGINVENQVVFDRIEVSILINIIKN